MNKEKEALLHLINSHTLLMNNIRSENYLGMLFYHGELLVKQIVHLRMFDDEMALMKEN